MTQRGSSPHKLVRISHFILLLLVLSSCDALFDFEAPKIEITKPEEGVSYFATLPIKLKVTDNRVVDKVEIFFDEESMQIFTEGPYTIDFDISELNAIPLTLKVIAHDKAGNYSEKKRNVSISLGYKVLSPNGGETWDEQSAQTVTWESSGDVGDVNLKYSLDNGTNWHWIDGQSNNDGLHNWTLPNVQETTGNCLVKVEGYSNEYVDLSDGKFTILAEENSITLTSPNGGEEWQEHTTQAITWTHSGDVGDYVDLYHSLDGGATWTQIISSTWNDGSMQWTLPNIVETKTNCRLKIVSSLGYYDVSDANFTILAEPNTIIITSPNGGEMWQEQTNQTITWNTSGDVGEEVSLSYSTDLGTSWQDITQATPNDGFANWTLPDISDTITTARVKIIDVSGSYSDVSDSSFSILPNPRFTEQIDKLAAPTGFSGAVSIDGNYIIIGAPYNDDRGNNAGAAMVYNYDPVSGALGSGISLYAFDASDDDEFGISVSINGDYAVVGADGPTWPVTKRRGNAYIFHRTSINNWDSGTKVTAQDGQIDDCFGYAVSINGDYAIIGAPLHDGMGDYSATGAVYVYKRIGTNVWDNGIKLVPPDIQTSEKFGGSVSIDGDYAVCGYGTYNGVRGVGSHGESDAEAAYIFHRTGVNTWDEGYKIISPSPVGSEYFGHSVDIDGAYIIIGAPRADSYSGKSYIFRRIGTNSWDNGVGLMYDSQYGLGWSVAINGSYAVATTSYSTWGHATIFRRLEVDTWQAGTKVEGNDITTNGWFGQGADMTNTLTVIGATGAGAIYVFK